MRYSEVRRALVRGVADTYSDCIKPDPNEALIDLQKVRMQHLAYCDTLERLGVTLTRIAHDNRFPDCCFVEDTVIVLGDTAIVSRPVMESRGGEADAVRAVLKGSMDIIEIVAPGFIDGGDVMRIEDKLFIGLSSRTNPEAVAQVTHEASRRGITVIPVEVRGTLHLKTVCTYIGEGFLVISPGHFDREIFTGYRQIVVPPQEAYSANCLAINGQVIIPGGYPQTKEKIAAAGFATVELDMSEFKKGGGGLTCLSILLYDQFNKN